MRKQFSWWSSAFAALALPLTGGCLQDTAVSAKAPAALASTALVSVPDEVTNVVITNSTSPDTATNSTPAEADVTEVAEVPEDGIVTAEAKPISWEKTVPPVVQTNALLTEIMKLAESGVGEGVMLAFVTNSTSVFNLNADQIIYLNDIGIPDSVVTAMLQQDQALKHTVGAPTSELTTIWGEIETNEAAELTAEEMAPQPTGSQVSEVQPEEQTQQVAAPPSEVTYSTFYSSLAPYGTWVEIDGYGRCWQPSVVVVNPGWQPYLHGGSWIYTDYGWYWDSDYSWGWAPFHYGRWFRHYRLGWCWYPDVYWGPSWVTWRYSSGYCGWAPLPPSACYYPGVGITYWGSHVGVSFTFGLSSHHYAYVPWHHFKRHGLHHHSVPHHQRSRIHHDTVVATRIEGNRNAANRGLPVDRVAAATKTEIRPVALREVRKPSGGGRVRPERLSSDGKTLAVYRPAVAETPRDLPEAVRRQRGGAATARDLTANRTRPELVGNELRQTGTTVPGRTRETRTPSTAAKSPATESVILERPVSARTLNPSSSTTIGVRTPEITRPGNRERIEAVRRDRSTIQRSGNPRQFGAPAASAPVTQAQSAQQGDRIEPLGARRTLTPGTTRTQVQPERGQRAPLVISGPSREVTNPSGELPTAGTVETPRRSVEGPRFNPVTPIQPNRAIETARPTVPQSSPTTSRAILPQATARTVVPSTPFTAQESIRSPRPVEVPRYTPPQSASPRQQQVAPPSYSPPQRVVAPSPQQFRAPDNAGSVRSAPTALTAPPARSFSAQPAMRPAGGGNSGGGGPGRGERSGR